MSNVGKNQEGYECYWTKEEQRVSVQLFGKRIKSFNKYEHEKNNFLTDKKLTKVIEKSKNSIFMKPFYL